LSADSTAFVTRRAYPAVNAAGNVHMRTPLQGTRVWAVEARQSARGPFRRMHMETLGKARRVRLYMSEDDRRAGKLLYRAVVELLRAETAQGATVIRAIEGFGAAGRLHVSSLADVAVRLPVIVEWIDRPEQVERLLPRVLELVQHGLVTVDETEILLFEPHPVRDLKPTATVASVMSRDVTSVELTTPIRRVVDAMLGKTYRAVPVTDGGRPVGIITNGDLVRRGGLGVRLDLLRSLDKPQMLETLDRLSQQNRTATEVMTKDPVTVTEATALPAAAELMARHRLKRLPVVDEQGMLAGVVSRLDLLRAAAAGGPASAPEAYEMGLAGDERLARVMRRDVPTVHPETPLPEAFQAVISTRLNRAFVVDAERRVVGLVSDAELIERITPALKSSALRALMNRLPFVHPKDDPVGSHARGRTAGEVMTRKFAKVREDVLLSEAIALMLREGQKVLAVTDQNGHLVGMVDRADLLHGLIPAPATGPAS
jgi:CBS domain-containing protein/PII-like signaling protein